jgi:hypothetical protein
MRTRVDLRTAFGVAPRSAFADLVVVVMLVAGGGCAKKRAPDPVVNVGAFTVAVPEAWHNVTDHRIEPGAVALQTLAFDAYEKDPLTLIVSPLPEPISGDPANANDCTASARRFDGTDVSTKIVELPVGKACLVGGMHGTTHVATLVVRRGAHGVMADCTARTSGHEMCDGMFALIAARE